MPDRWGLDPRWRVPDDGEDHQDDRAQYDHPDDWTDERMEVDMNDGGDLSRYNFLDAEDPTYHALNNNSSYDTFAGAHDTHLGVNFQDDTQEYHEYPETPGPLATSSDDFDLDCSLRRTGTMNTDFSIRPYQGSDPDSDGDFDDGRQDARQRDPVQLADAHDRHKPYMPPGYGNDNRLTEMAGGISDIGSYPNMPVETSKKKGKRRKDKETSGSCDNSSSSRHQHKRRDHDDRDPSRKQRSSKNPW